MGKKENVAIVIEGLEAGKTDDQILQELFESGVDFGDMRKVFEDIIKEKGLRLSPKERKEKTATLLEGVTEIADVDAMTKIVAMLEKKLKVAATKAKGSLNTWAKANGIELPRAPRIAKERKAGFGGHYKNILDFVLEQRAANKPYTKVEVIAFCHKEGIPEGYNALALNCVHFAKAWNGEATEEVATEA